MIKSYGSVDVSKTHKKTSQPLGIVLVAYDNKSNISNLLNKLVAEKQKDDFIVLIDNHPDHDCALIAEKFPEVDIVIRSENIGFAAGCNLAASKLPDSIELILFVNPDVRPKAGAISKLRQANTEDWSAWMGLLVLPDGNINTSGNIVHMSGLSWCNDYGKKPDFETEYMSVNFLSGACLMIRRSVWEQLGGFSPDYFMYYEDTDLSTQLLLRGLKMGVVTSAVFVHDYEFNKGQQKWYYLERNRYLMISRLWPAAVIVVLLPFLMAIEVGLWLESIFTGRFITRLRSVKSVIGLWPKTWRQHQALKAHVKIKPSQFINNLSPYLDSPFFNSVLRSKAVNMATKVYYQFAKLLLTTLGK